MPSILHRTGADFTLASFSNESDPFAVRAHSLVHASNGACALYWVSSGSRRPCRNLLPLTMPLVLPNRREIVPQGGTEPC
jgi:hypothetical protein